MGIERHPRVRLDGRATLLVTSDACVCPGHNVTVIFWGDRWTVDCPHCGRSITGERKDEIIHDLAS